MRLIWSIWDILSSSCWVVDYRIEYGLSSYKKLHGSWNIMEYHGMCKTDLWRFPEIGGTPKPLWLSALVWLNDLDVLEFWGTPILGDLPWMIQTSCIGTTVLTDEHPEHPFFQSGCKSSENEESEGFWPTTSHNHISSEWMMRYRWFCPFSLSDVFFVGTLPGRRKMHVYTWGERPSGCTLPRQAVKTLNSLRTGELNHWTFLPFMNCIYEYRRTRCTHT